MSHAATTARHLITTNWRPFLAALLTMLLVTIIGVVFWFRPIAEADSGATPVAPAVAFLLYCGLSVVLFTWVARRMNSGYAAALAVGAAQYILALDLTLRGERGIATAGASAILIMVTWAAVAFSYTLVERRTAREVT